MDEASNQAARDRNDRIEIVVTYPDVTVSIRVSNRGGFFVMDETVDHLVTANDGETLELEIVVSAAIRAIEADIVEIYVGFKEYYGNGNFDFRRS